MGVFGSESDLTQMKEYLETKISSVRIIGDLVLDEDDFKQLGVELKSAFSFGDDVERIEKYSLCYLVYWVYALIYWDEEIGIHDELTDYCASLPQYRIRYHLQMLMDTFANYGLYDFGYHAGSIEEQCSMMIARHAGIPDCEKYKVFEVIEDYRNHSDSVDMIVTGVYGYLPYRSRYIFSLMDNESRREIIWEIRTIMAMICSDTYDEEYILEKYPHVSKRLIDYCYSWRKERLLTN